MERYEVLDSVGEGTYGLVLRCVHKCTGTHVAIKKFKESKDEETVRRTAARELEVVRTLHHTNLVSFLESFHANGKLHLVFEFMDRTLLHDMELMQHGIPYETVESYMLQLVQAVHFLHQNKVMHRDLKPENMLLSEDGVLKLCDFGFARHLGGLNTKYSEYVATRWYRPPELLLGYTQYGLAVDVWALGCLLVEMATGEPLFPGKTDIDQLWLIMKATGHLTRHQMQVMQQNPHLASIRVPPQQMRDTLERRFPRLTHKQLQFVKACIQPEPARRPKCSQLLQMPYLQDAASNMPHSALAAQEASQQRVAAFKAAAHLSERVSVQKGRKMVNLNASSRNADLGLLATSAAAERARSASHDINTTHPAAGRARSPHERQAVPGPFLSPSAAPFQPRGAQPLQDQESDVSMPDWAAQEVKGKPNRLPVGKGNHNPSKQHIGFRLDSLQANGSGLIGTGHTSAGGSGGTARNSKRSLLPDLMLEGEQSHQSSLEVPSSPPKKFKWDSSRPEDPSMPSRFSDLQMPGQAGMSNDRDHVMMSQPGQNVLLGAESLVSRAPMRVQSNGSTDHPRRRHDSYNAATRGVSHAEAEAQHAEQESWCSAAQGTSHQRADIVQPQGQMAASGAHQGQVPGNAPAGGQFWDRLDGQSGQQTFFAAGYQPDGIDSQHASRAYTESSYQAQALVHERAQDQSQSHPAALFATQTAAWSVRTPQQQQQQQQQQMRFPSVTDFNPADFNSSAASSPGLCINRVVSGTRAVWDRPTSAESYSTESEASECEEQVMYEGHLEAPQRIDAGSASWPIHDVPQVQMMSRETHDGNDKDL